MNQPKQLKLPLRPPRGPSVQDCHTRLVRMESRMVQLMKHLGMKDDGRGHPLPEDRSKETA